MEKRKVRAEGSAEPSGTKRSDAEAAAMDSPSSCRRRRRDDTSGCTSSSSSSSSASALLASLGDDVGCEKGGCSS